MERDRRKMKGKRVIAGILLAGILAVTLAGCKNTDNTKEETERPVITLGSDNYPPYNYLNEDGVSWAAFPWKGVLMITAGRDHM